VPSYHVENFGCRATQADGAALERQFAVRGLVRATAASADVVVLNTCTVTNSADQDARAAIRRVRRQNPQARIVVTGCYAQRAPEEIAALPGVSCVIGNSHKHQLADLALNRVVPQQQNFIPLLSLTLNGQGTKAGGQRPTTDGQLPLYVSDIFAHTELLAAPVFESGSQAGNRTRPNLKVQDGCNNRCSFCVIPSVRGHSRSLSPERVIDEVNALVAAGYRELVISGINLGRWGRDLGVSEDDFRERQTPNDQRLVSLVRSILDRTQLEKLRISSVEPMDWTDDLISLVASSPRIAKHAHVPLQSGSDAVLRRMHRKYRPWHYHEKIEKIHSAMPTAAIGADVMVGFPGETHAEFESTRRLVEDLPFTYLHVFTYSARPGTPAAAMPNQVPIHVARERNKILRDLAAKKKAAFMRGFIGEQLEAITLGLSQDGSANTLSFRATNTLSSRAKSLFSRSENEDAVEGPCVSAGPVFTEALTDNYQKLLLKGQHAPNRWMTVQIECAEDATFVGSLMPEA
jgi:threonylcarbamoyladenosine tRNA methylthiotransferase MtaB